MERRKAIWLGVAGVLGMLGFKNRERAGSNQSFTTNADIKMKTIGILGGLGPQATTDLEARIHRVSQGLIPQYQNTGYPPVVTIFHRHVPVAMKADGTPVIPLQPDPRLLESAKRLGPICDFIIMPSNGIHALQKEIEQASGRKMLSMIDVTLDEVKKRGWKKVGVLAFKSTLMYTNRLNAIGVAVETIEPLLSAKLDESIASVMEGADTLEDNKVAVAAVEELRSRKVDGIIPGCTELPFLLEGNWNDAEMVNPLYLLADAAVRFAIA